MKQNTNDGKGNMAAWIICQDLVLKIRDELKNQAIATLDNEIKEGRMKVNGQVLTLDPENKEEERSMFLISNLIEQHEEMIRGYSDYISKNEARDDLKPQDILNMESIKKLMLAMKKIVMLMGYSNLLGMVYNDIGMKVRQETPSKILVELSSDYPDLPELLNFVLSYKPIAEAGLLSQSDESIIKDALAQIPKENSHEDTSMKT